MATEVQKGKLYRATADMLRRYRADKARVAILNLDLAAIERELTMLTKEAPDEVIAGVYFAGREMSGMPHGSGISDRTAWAAEAWRKEHDEEWRRWQQLVEEQTRKSRERETLLEKLQKIDVAIDSLLPIEKQVVTLFYVQGKGWGDVSAATGYSAVQCGRIRDRAVWYMTLSLFARRNVRQ